MLRRQFQWPHRSLSVRGEGSRGFTVVELMVVIVAIAILAAITIVSYNGTQNRANDAAVLGDLRNTFDNLQLYQSDHYGSFPLSTDNASLQTIFVATKTSYYTTVNAYVYCRSNAAAAVMAISKSKTGYFFSSANGQGTVSTATWGAGGNATLCPLAGILTTDAGYGFTWYHLSASGWTW